MNRRRTFIKNTALSASLVMFSSFKDVQPLRNLKPVIRFSVININHSHIYGMVNALIHGGGELVSVYAKEQDLLASFTKAFPQAKIARSQKEILEDNSIQVILSSGIPDERAPLGIEVMKYGKDYLVDKPGIISLEQLEEVKQVQQSTKRIYSIMFSERFENNATVKASELVKSGAIGNVIQTIGLGPHRMNTKNRPSWFFDKKRYGGIITDIGSHQFDQFLFFTGSSEAEILSSQVGNVNHPEFPNFEDYGDVTLRGNNGAGYIRVDWFTPDSLKTWGDARLTILGTEGYIEVRKNIDIVHSDRGNHLFLVNQEKTTLIDCSNVLLPFGSQFINDVINRTETAMSQKHCFLATELSLKAQAEATPLVPKWTSSGKR